MIICLGSKNPVKLKALKTGAMDFFEEKKIEFKNFEVPSLVSDQPIGLEETIKGASNRAINAFKNTQCFMGCGIESGIFKDPLENIYYNTTVCALYNGQKIFKGIGPAFRLPDKTAGYLINDNMELDEAVQKSGYTMNKRIGYSEGLIGILSNGKVDRMKYTIPAVQMAFISFVNDL
ncbi:MAG: inosine/xanthosine triphosphatase [Desulforegulaceae bacterium]|jgi:inosine/xanthosine triphosphatase|nr:inosine/xanthosine triphosphatase [Desulforegulaceae bacterium]